MKLLLLNLLLLASLYAAPAGAQVPLVRDGVPVAVVVVPNGGDAHYARAAKAFCEYVHHATNATLALLTDDTYQQGPFVALGPTSLTAAAGITSVDLKWGGYRMVSDDHGVYLLGDDRGSPDEPDDWLYFGTRHAMLALLEEFGGFRWLMPGQLGVHIPRRATLTIPSGLNRTSIPRVAQSLDGLPEALDYSLANGFQTAPSLKHYADSTWETAVPAERYFSTSPQLFALSSGHRRPGQLCLSEPRVRQLVAAEVARQFERGYEMVQLTQPTSFSDCQCDRCRTTPAEARVWQFHNGIAAALARDWPDRRVLLTLRKPTHTLPPPGAIRRFAPNVIVQLRDPDPEVVAAFHRLGVTQFAAYVGYWGAYRPLGYCPKVAPETALEAVHFFVTETGATLLDSSRFTECFALQGPLLYVLGRTLWDGARDPAALEEEYYSLYFGQAAAPMRQFFRVFYERLSHREQTRDIATSTNDLYAMLFPPQTVADLDRWLGRGLEAASDSIHRRRVQVVQRTWDYLRLTLLPIHLARAYQLHPTRQQLSDLQAAVTQRADYIVRLYLEDGDNPTGSGEDGAWDQGRWPTLDFEQPLSDLLAGGARGQLQAPFTWDFETKLRNFEREVASWRPPTLEVPFTAAAPTIDGTLTDAVWKQVFSVPLQQLAGGAPEVYCTVQAVYDTEALYVACEAEEPLVDQLNLPSLGHDGRVYTQDDFELFLNPSCDGRRYYQFIANPQADSYFEQRVGFSEDPSHPVFGHADDQWDGNWTYAFSLDTPNKVWRLELRVPFASLAVQTPKPNTVWLGQFGRQRFVGRERRHRQRFLWSPNVRGGTFHDTNLFGDLVFTR